MSDFTNIVEAGGTFEAVELDAGVDFVATGDQGVIIVTGSGWGDDWGGPWGGEDESIIISTPTTAWTNVDEP